MLAMKEQNSCNSKTVEIMRTCRPLPHYANGIFTALEMKQCSYKYSCFKRAVILVAWLQVAWEVLTKAGGITVSWEDPSTTKVPSILIHLTLLSVKNSFLYKVLYLLLFNIHLWGGMMQNPSPSLSCHVHCVPPILPPNSEVSSHLEVNLTASFQNLNRNGQW